MLLVGLVLLRLRNPTAVRRLVPKSPAGVSVFLLRNPSPHRRFYQDPGVENRPRSRISQVLAM